jgi:hypothetical protein
MKPVAWRGGKAEWSGEYALVRRRTPETAAEVAFFGRLLTVTPVEKVHCLEQLLQYMEI